MSAAMAGILGAAAHPEHAHARHQDHARQGSSSFFFTALLALLSSK
jgi:hypothetical protein